MPTERTLARVCREAGATVRTNVKFAGYEHLVSAMDNMAIEVLATGLRTVGDRYHLEVGVDDDRGTMSRWRDNERCGAPVCTTGEAGQVQGTVGCGDSWTRWQL